MKFEVLKDVVIDGKRYPAGEVVDIHHDKTSRLEMLGYLKAIVVTENRAVGIEDSPKPRTRRKSK